MHYSKTKEDMISSFGDICIERSPQRVFRFVLRWLKGLIYKNLQNAAEGGMAPRQMIPTAVTPTVIPPSAAYIAIWQVSTANSF